MLNRDEEFEDVFQFLEEDDVAADLAQGLVSYLGASDIGADAAWLDELSLLTR